MGAMVPTLTASKEWQVIEFARWKELPVLMHAWEGSKSEGEGIQLSGMMRKLGRYCETRGESKYIRDKRCDDIE